MTAALLTDEELLDIVAGETNIADDTKAMGMLALYWKRTASISVRDIRVLETKAAVLRYLIGTLRNEMSIRIGPDILNLEARYKHVVEMLGDTEHEILEAKGLTGPPSVSVARGASYLPEYRGYSREVDGKTQW